MKYCYFFIFIFLFSCSNNKYYIKRKSFPRNYYCVKQKRKDNLRLLIFTEGIPHFSYTKIYANEGGRVTKIIIERDEQEFYQAVTDVRNNEFYFEADLVKHIDSIAINIDSVKGQSVYEQTIQSLFNGKHCTDLQFPKMIGLVRIERPKDYIRHLGHIKLLKKINSK